MIADRRMLSRRTTENGVNKPIRSGLAILSLLFISGVYAIAEHPFDKRRTASDKEETFFNSEPVYRKIPLASLRKRPPPKKQMENVRGLYYIVDAFGYTTADAERSGQYRALGSTVFVEETLLTEKTTEE